MKLFKSLRNAVLAVMLLSAGAANAALLTFSLTGGYTASWQLDSAPAPNGGTDGVYFVLTDVPGFPDAALGVADIFFFNAGFSGGLGINDTAASRVLLLADGPQLYSGTEDKPVFNLGTFSLTQSGGTQPYLLTIALATTGGGGADIPEPATGALLLAGLGVIGVLRKRHGGALAWQDRPRAA